MTTKESTTLDLPSGLALIGGILMIFSGMLSFYHMTVLPMMGMMGQWMTGASIFYGIFGIGCGVAVIVGTMMMSRRPGEVRAWALLVLIFAVLSFIEMGGFIIGAVLAIIGSIMTLVTKR